MAAPEVPPSPSCRSETVTTADGLRLHVACYGEPRPGARTVLCLPGLTRTGADFEPLARALAADPQLPRRVLALDYRGRGQSDYDPDPARASEVEITFTPEGDGTRVELVHRNFERHFTKPERVREGVGGEGGWGGILLGFQQAFV